MPHTYKFLRHVTHKKGEKVKYIIIYVSNLIPVDKKMDNSHNFQVLIIKIDHKKKNNQNILFDR